MKTALLISLSLFALNVITQARAHEIKGDKVSIGSGYGYTYVQFNAKNRPVSLGVALNSDALLGLPAVDESFSLPLPKNVSLPPYQEIIVNWNALGHEPPGVYDIPHFDFHFYVISKSERESIMCMGEDMPICIKQPINDFLAPFYIPTPSGVPMMGWHWLDSRSPELNGARFTSTFINGYYNGELIFIEPMVTREFLMANGSHELILSTPKRYAFGGYYPKKYTVNYDSAAKIYRIALKNLHLVEAKK